MNNIFPRFQRVEILQSDEQAVGASLRRSYAKKVDLSYIVTKSLGVTELLKTHRLKTLTHFSISGLSHSNFGPVFQKLKRLPSNLRSFSLITDQKDIDIPTFRKILKKHKSLSQITLKINFLLELALNYPAFISNLKYLQRATTIRLDHAYYFANFGNGEQDRFDLTTSVPILERSLARLKHLRVLELENFPIEDIETHKSFLNFLRKRTKVINCGVKWNGIDLVTEDQDMVQRKTLECEFVKKNSRLSAIDISLTGIIGSFGNSILRILSDSITETPSNIIKMNLVLQINRGECPANFYKMFKNLRNLKQLNLKIMGFEETKDQYVFQEIAKSVGTMHNLEFLEFYFSNAVADSPGFLESLKTSISQLGKLKYLDMKMWSSESAGYLPLLGSISFIPKLIKLVLFIRIALPDINILTSVFKHQNELRHLRVSVYKFWEISQPEDRERLEELFNSIKNIKSLLILYLAYSASIDLKLDLLQKTILLDIPETTVDSKIHTFTEVDFQKLFQVFSLTKRMRKYQFEADIDLSPEQFAQVCLDNFKEEPRKIKLTLFSKTSGKYLQYGYL